MLLMKGMKSQVFRLRMVIGPLAHFFYGFGPSGKRGNLGGPHKILDFTQWEFLNEHITNFTVPQIVKNVKN